MISSATIKHMHEALGYPTDEATIKERFSELEEIESERILDIKNAIVDQELEKRGTTIIDGDLTYMAVTRAQRQAQEEILEEYVNAPMREYYEQQDKLEEQQWREAAE